MFDELTFANSIHQSRSTSIESGAALTQVQQLTIKAAAIRKRREEEEEKVKQERRDAATIDGSHIAQTPLA